MADNNGYSALFLHIMKSAKMIFSRLDVKNRYSFGFDQVLKQFKRFIVFCLPFLFTCKQ